MRKNVLMGPLFRPLVAFRSVSLSSHWKFINSSEIESIEIVVIRFHCSNIGNRCEFFDISVKALDKRRHETLRGWMVDPIENAQE